MNPEVREHLLCAKESLETEQTAIDKALVSITELLDEPAAEPQTQKKAPVAGTKKRRSKPKRSSNNNHRSDYCEDCGKSFSNIYSHRESKAHKQNALRTTGNGETPKAETSAPGFDIDDQALPPTVDQKFEQLAEQVDAMACGTCGERFATPTLLRRHRLAVDHYEEDEVAS